MKKILYVGQIAIEGSASCTHVRNRARFFNNIGYEVYGLSECPKNECDKVEDTGTITRIKDNPLATCEYTAFHIYIIAYTAISGINPGA